jgi:uncharacterized surface protein with fasciclin (FAS1) repeats
MQYRILAASVAAAGLAVGAAACSSSSSTPAAAAPSSSAASTPMPASSSPMASSSASAAGASTTSDFGPGCASVPMSGAGSFTGMATAPVATAASANPLLSTLVTAVKQAGLVNTLNSAAGITVFAPDNAAFAKIPASTLKTVLADKPELTKILTYHVVAGKLEASDLTDGKKLKTVQGEELTVKRSGDTVMIIDAKGGSSTVTIPNVNQSNGVIHVVDTVLMPS